MASEVAGCRESQLSPLARTPLISLTLAVSACGWRGSCCPGRAFVTAPLGGTTSQGRDRGLRASAWNRWTLVKPLVAAGSPAAAVEQSLGTFGRAALASGVAAVTAGASLRGKLHRRQRLSYRQPGSRTAIRMGALPSLESVLESFQRWALKRDLLAVLDGCERGTLTTDDQKAEIFRLIDALAKLNPTQVAGTLLSGRWKLLWTTEKETLALAGGGVLGRAVTDVYQLIDAEKGTLSNNIDFEGGAFEVDSTCEPSDGIRVDFAFNAARVRFGDIALPLPPVGKGWFDCVYLDDEIRIVRDSRDDALIALRE